MQDEYKHMLKERQSGMYRLSAFYVARLLSDLPMDLALPTVQVRALLRSALHHTWLHAAFPAAAAAPSCRCCLPLPRTLPMPLFPPTPLCKDLHSVLLGRAEVRRGRLPRPVWRGAPGHARRPGKPGLQVTNEVLSWRLRPWVPDLAGTPANAPFGCRIPPAVHRPAAGRDYHGAQDCADAGHGADGGWCCCHGHGCCLSLSSHLSITTPNNPCDCPPRSWSWCSPAASSS